MSDGTSNTPSSPVADWTVDPATGRSNSSPEFLRLIKRVGQIIRSDAVARIVLASLAHEEHLVPADYKGVDILSIKDDGRGGWVGTMSFNDQMLRFTTQPLTPEGPDDTTS